MCKAVKAAPRLLEVLGSKTCLSCREGCAGSEGKEQDTVLANQDRLEKPTESYRTPQLQDEAGEVGHCSVGAFPGPKHHGLAKSAALHGLSLSLPRSEVLRKSKSHCSPGLL